MSEPGQKDIKAALEIDCYCGCDDPMSSEPKCDTLQDAVCRPHRQMAQALAAAREEGRISGRRESQVWADNGCAKAERERILGRIREWAKRKRLNKPKIHDEYEYVDAVLVSDLLAKLAEIEKEGTQP